MTGAVFYLSDSIIETSGNTSSNDNSSFYGLNAAVLPMARTATPAKSISRMLPSHHRTGANAAFASCDGSVVSLVDVTIYATATVATCDGDVEGEMTLINVDMSTAGKTPARLPPIAQRDHCGDGGVVQTSGADHPHLFDGQDRCHGRRYHGDRVRVRRDRGSNYITLTDTLLTSSMVDKWGVFIIRACRGMRKARRASHHEWRQAGQPATTGPLFYVTNATGTSPWGCGGPRRFGTLLQAEANSRWGTSGEKRGTAYLVATDQALTGDLIADSISAITATLQSGSYLTGSINSDQEASWVSLTLDASSSWDVAADSYLNCLYLPDGLPAALTTPIPNIIGNGYTVYYKASSCSALDGETYSLTDGGYLKPTGSSDTDDYSLFLPLVVRE